MYINNHNGNGINNNNNKNKNGKSINDINNKNMPARFLTAAFIFLIAVVTSGAGRPLQASGAEPAVRSAVILKDGNVISGEILKNKSGAVIIDNVYQVFNIPAERIERIENYGGAAALSVYNQTALPERGLKEKEAPRKNGSVFFKGFPPSKLFNLNNDARQGPIEILVERYEDGVVQIKTPSGSGSGFIISDEGHILTNCHVIENETEISVTIFEKAGREFSQIKLDDIKIVALNPFYDLALLKIENKLKKPPVKCYFAGNSHTKKGESVFAIGNPYGLTRSISQGIIADSERYVGGLIYIQTTAPINAGNSGGPLFNMNGEVIGVINMAYFLADGIGFGIPLNYVYDFLANIEAYSFDKDNPDSGYMYNKPPRRAAF